jgi:uncharacterized membrane protein YeiH
VRLLPLFDYGATLIWAASGALLASRQGYDVVGIFFVALASATGGGLLRDGLFLQDGPPVLVQTPTYLLIVAAATALVAFFGPRVQRMSAFQKFVNLVDALGLGAYAVVGMTRAIPLELSLPGIALVGVLNAVGGSVLRDVIMRREPHLFRPGTLEAVAALAGCIVFLSLTTLGAVGQVTAAWVTVAVAFAVRAAAVKCGVETRPLGAHRRRRTAARGD